MTAGAPALREADLPLLRRLWIYQGERIPLVRTGVLSAVFAAAGVNVSAFLAGRALPSPATYLVAALAVLAFFIVLRVSDEVKDAETDRAFRPERAVPRGLVDLPTLIALGAGAAVLSALSAAMLTPGLVLVMAAAYAFMALMAVEFFLGDWLRGRPILYMLSHMAVMPLIDLFVTACEWLPAAGAPPSGLGLFILLSFVNGLVLEIGRKTWAPSMERTGVETYSAVWGPRRAILVWLALVVFAFALAVLTGVQLGAVGLVALATGAALCAAALLAGAFLREPSPRLAGALETASGLWVFVCYAALGFLPLLSRHL